MVGWMSYWSQRSETGVRSRRWSRRMAAFSWALGRFRVFLGMGEPPLEIVAYSSDPFFPFRLKQNRITRRTAVEPWPCHAGLAGLHLTDFDWFPLFRHAVVPSSFRNLVVRRMTQTHCPRVSSLRE